MKELVNGIERWIKNDVFKSSKNPKVVIGMSGGKDSLIVAKLCAEAIGKENVIGIIIPNGHMNDINDAISTCQYLGIKTHVANIGEAFNSLTSEINDNIDLSLNRDSLINLAPRLRMATLYAYAATYGAFVANTSNLSEVFVGYSTKWGDNAGDFSPIAKLTKTEVVEIGKYYKLPAYLVDKAPSDGLTGKSDEDNMGIKYEDIDKYIRKGSSGNTLVDTKILDRFNKNLHKRNNIQTFDPTPYLSISFSPMLYSNNNNDYQK